MENGFIGYQKAVIHSMDVCNVKKRWTDRHVNEVPIMIGRVLSAVVVTSATSSSR